MRDKYKEKKNGMNCLYVQDFVSFTVELNRYMYSLSLYIFKRLCNS